MTEDEKNYLYFKVHDLDGNDKLDGLEIYYSATHHSVSQDVDGSGDDAPTEVKLLKSDNVFAMKLHPSADDDPMQTGIDPSNLRMLENDNNGELIDKNFNHIIGKYECIDFLPASRSNRMRSTKTTKNSILIPEILDNFLNIADLNQDGYLNFPEYAAAVKLGNAMASAEAGELNNMYY